MLDIKFILENLDLVKENCKDRLANSNVDLLVSKYKEKLSIQQKIEELSAIKNKYSKTKPTEEIIKEVNKINKEIDELNPKLEGLEKEVKELLFVVPNLTHKDVVKSQDEDNNPVLEIVGDPIKFDFTPKDHVELAESLDLIDFERATKVSGAKFYYLKNQGALLEMALINYAMEICLKHNFTPFVTPDLAKREILEGLGFNPRGESTQVYNIEGTDISLVGTAEITMGGYHANEVFLEEELPKKYVALSHCFRTEAGAYSKFSKGIYRVHQFTKVEMFSYCKPEDAEKIHNELLEIEKEIFIGLKIPFRVIDHCTADLGSPSYRTFDLEAFMPGKPNKDGTMGDYGEITSTSNCTDYQSRALNIKYKTQDNKKELVYTLNGTAISLARALICIIENYQTKEGEILIPKVLEKYMFDIKKICKK